MLVHIVTTAESLLLARGDLSLGGRNQRNRRDSEVLKDAARLLCTKIGAQRQERVRKKTGRSWPENGPVSNVKEEEEEEDKKKNGCLSVVSVVCCQVEVSSTG